MNVLLLLGDGHDCLLEAPDGRGGAAVSPQQRHGGAVQQIRAGQHMLLPLARQLAPCRTVQENGA